MNTMQSLSFAEEADLNHIFFLAYPQTAALYQASERHYHNRQHLDSLLFQLDQVMDYVVKEGGLYALHVARLALLYHDAYYQPLSPGFNESMSASLFEESYIALLDHQPEQKRTDLLKYDIPNDVCTAIKCTARHTEEHPAQLPFSHKIVLDLDIREIGTDKFKWNKRLLMREAVATGEVDPIKYAEWCINFCVKMLRKECIYYTGLFHKLYEEKARANLRADYNLMWRVLCGGARHHDLDVEVMVPTDRDLQLFHDLDPSNKQMAIERLLMWPRPMPWSYYERSATESDFKEDQ